MAGIKVSLPQCTGIAVSVSQLAKYDSCFSLLGLSRMCSDQQHLSNLVTFFRLRLRKTTSPAETSSAIPIASRIIAIPQPAAHGMLIAWQLSALSSFMVCKLTMQVLCSPRMLHICSCREADVLHQLATLMIILHTYQSCQHQDWLMAQWTLHCWKSHCCWQLYLAQEVQAIQMKRRALALAKCNLSLCSQWLSTRRRMNCPLPACNCRHACTRNCRGDYPPVSCAPQRKFAPRC